MAEIETTKNTLTQPTQETQTNGKGFEIEKMAENNNEENLKIKEGTTEIKESINKGKETKIVDKWQRLREMGFKKGQSGNKKGRPKTEFSIMKDIIKELKWFKKNKPDLYKQKLREYILKEKFGQFLVEMIDGKARQSTELSGSLQDPVRIVEVRIPSDIENEVKE